MISKRHVFFVAGFDPIDTRSHHARFVREFKKFEQTWRLAGSVSDVVSAAGDDGEHWRVTTEGAGWKTETTFEPCDWQDIVADEIGRSTLQHLTVGLITFLDFVFTGTAFRYFRAAWRYGAFFLVPVATLFLFAVIAVAVGAMAADLSSVTVFWRVVVVALVAIVVFAGLMQWPGQRWRTNQALADWTFARDYLYGRHQEMALRVEEFAKRLVAQAHEANLDEIMIAGHSLGATIAIDMIARAFRLDPEFAGRGPKISLLTIGSTIPKITLHPAASALREAARKIAASPDITWTEFQMRRDPISFFMFDPVVLRRTGHSAPGRSPQIRQVSLKHMVTKETYERIKWRFMRVHYQFVFANEVRAPYDFLMLTCGPDSLADVTTLPHGTAGVLDADGRYRTAPNFSGPAMAAQATS